MAEHEAETIAAQRAVEVSAQCHYAVVMIPRLKIRELILMSAPIVLLFVGAKWL